MEKIVTMLLILTVFSTLVTGCNPKDSENSATTPANNPAHSDSAANNTASNPPSSAAPQGDNRTTAVLPEIDRNITATLTITGINPDRMDGIIQLFNFEFPNVTVVKDVVSLTSSNTRNAAAATRTRFNTQILSGQAGDIIMTSGSNPVNFFQQRILANLHEFMYSDSQFNHADYFMNVIEAYSYNGNLYVMPLENSIEMLGFYEPLAGGYSFTDNSDVWELTQALNEAQILADQNGLKGRNYIYPTPDYHLFGTLLSLNYAEFINLETGKVNINCAEFIDMLKYVKGLADAGYISSSERANNVSDGAPVISRGDTGQAPIALQSDVFGIRPLTGKNGELNIAANAGNTTLAINQQSTNKRLAWEFIKCALSYEAQSSPNSRGNPPINRVALRVYIEHRYMMAKDTSQHGDADEAEAIRQYEELIVSLNDRVSKYTFTDFDIDDIIFEQITAYFEGKISAEETAQILQRKISMVIEG